MKSGLKIGLILVLWVVQGFASTYEIDPDHSNVTFKIRHLIGKVQGRFDKFNGTIEYDSKKPESWKVSATIDSATINTNNSKRDEHLRSKDFFDVVNPQKPEFKTIKFDSKKVTDIKNNKVKLHGDLMIHGVTKPVVLELEILGEGTDPWGNKKAAFSASTTVNRKDYGLTWNKALEAGGVLVGEEVEISLEIESQLKK